MSEEEQATIIAKAVVETLEKNRSITTDVHNKHHEFIDTVIMQTQKRAAMWEGIRKQVIGWGIIAFLSGVGLMFWQWLQYFVNHGGK